MYRDDIYCAVIITKPLREFTRFIWWMQTQRRGDRQPSRPSQPTWTASPPERNGSYRPYLPSPFLANVLRYVRYMLSAVRLSVVCLLSVCLLSVTLVHPTQAVELLDNFFHHTITQGLYFSGAKNHWWGKPLSSWNLRSKWPTPFKTAQFRPISAHSASTVISSEKHSISTYRKSTTCFPTSHRWTVYVTPKSPKGWHKNAILVCASKIQLLSKKVCYKVSLYENFQRQSCSYIIPLSNGP